MFSNMNLKRIQGFSILEVLIAILIFAFGLLALAQLQGRLAQSAGYTKSKASALNLAEDKLECMRSFSQIPDDGDGGYCDSQAPNLETSYAEITDGADAFGNAAQGGSVYGAEWDVVEYWEDGAGGFQTTDPAAPGTSQSAYKQVTVRVGWVDAVDGVGTAGFGNNNDQRAFVELVDLIPAIDPSASGQVLAGPQAGFGPTVAYTPGQNPDVVAISLGNQRFKETLLPEPEVFRKQDDEFVVTAFDVITFTQSGNGSSFLRREEFLMLNCECELGGSGQGRRPTVFNGIEYVEGEFATKTVGTPSSNRNQDALCELCCRDHHDGGSATDGEEGDGTFSPEQNRLRYDPFKPGAEYSGGNHKHYGLDNSGALQVAGQGDTYLENCRLIRKDGFFRVAQDIDVKVLSATPEDYLVSQSDVDTYSTFLTRTIADLVGDNTETDPSDPVPTTASLPAASADPSTCDIDNPGDTNDQCLRSRVLYLDYVNNEAQSLYDCYKGGGDQDSCDAPGVFGKFETLPFFELNTTNLSEWSEDPVDDPIDVANQRLENFGTYFRGLAELTGSGGSDVSTEIAESNTGLTNTTFIAPRGTDDDLDIVDTLEFNGGGPPTITPDIDGTITRTRDARKAADPNQVGITALNDTLCNQVGENFECQLGSSGTAEFRVSGYNTTQGNNVNNFEACAYVTSGIGVSATRTVTGNGTLTEYTDVTVSGPLAFTAVIEVRIDTSCP